MDGDLQQRIMRGRTRGASFVLMMLLFALFTAVGAAMLVGGEGDERFAGLACMLLFGVGGVAYAASKSRRAEAALRAESLTWQGQVVRALVVPVRRSKWLTMMLGLLGMGVASLLIGLFAPTFTDPGESALVTQLIGFGAAALFLLLALASVLNLRKGAPRLALLPQGIAMIGGVVESFIPWEGIANVGQFDMVIRGAGQRFAGVRATDPSVISRPRSSKAVMAGNRTFSGWDLTYAESMFDLTAEELTALIGCSWQRPELRRAAESLPDGPLWYAEFAARHLSAVGG